MSAIKRFFGLIVLAYFLFSSVVSAQVIEAPAEPDPTGGVGPVLECYVQTNPICANFVTPIAGSCTGLCVVTVVFPEGNPNQGVVVHTCPQVGQEALKNKTVRRVRALVASESQIGIDGWEIETATVDCLSYDYCLCIPNPNGTGKVCSPCGCGHTHGAVQQTKILGSVCNEPVPGNQNQ